MNFEFYKNKKVFITGNSGFKGSWLTKALLDLGADVTGYSLQPPTEPNLFSICGLKNQINYIEGDVRNLDFLIKKIKEAKPEIVFHLAAQPLVRVSYSDPVLTYETNVMGTVNICEAVRQCESVKSFLNITTDKVYENKEWVWGYRENEALDGYDPYSNSKSCSELVTHSYKKSFFNSRDIAVSTARAGNVIGGGDFSKDRIIPDCIRASIKKEPIIVRNPNSVRPYQHVLEPIFAYLLIAEEQFNNNKLQGYYNVGPNESDSLSTGKLATLFCKNWGNGATWISQNDNGPHEANFLRLDCSLIKNHFRWAPKWNAEKAVEETVKWTKIWLHSPKEVSSFMSDEIMEYCKE